VESDPKRVKDARQSVFDRGVIAIAASIAEKRVMHPIVDDGCVPLLPTRERKTAIHESAHAVAAVALKRFVYEVSIEPGQFSAGRVIWSQYADVVPQRWEN
jgi:hypothetical protein